MNQKLIDLCPFREQTASRKLYLSLARSDSPLSKSEIARTAHLTVARTALLLAAYTNKAHRAPMDRVGVRLIRTKDGGYMLEVCKPKPNAKRPPRGVPKKLPVKKAKKRASGSSTKDAASPIEPRAESKPDGGCEVPRKKRAKKPAVSTDSPVETPNAHVASENGHPAETAN
jgi:hypothetical protein